MAADRPAYHGGFTLVELLVVIGIISLLIAFLMPALDKAQQAAKATVCESNMRQVGVALLDYADDHNGYMFPPDMGYDPAHVIPWVTDGSDDTNPATIHNVWTTAVFINGTASNPAQTYPGQWDPPIMICPVDQGQNPKAMHTYVLNDHMQYWNVKYTTKIPEGRSPSDVILAGEKFTTGLGDYYMEYGDFPKVVDTKKHGLAYGSNYLYLDLHVDHSVVNTESTNGQFALDPWDFADGKAPPTTAPNNGNGQ